MKRQSLGKRKRKEKKGMDRKRVFFAVNPDGSKTRISKAEFERRQLLNLPVQVSLVAVGTAASLAAIQAIQ